jgi:two-component system, sporulation sensor kinase B
MKTNQHVIQFGYIFFAIILCMAFSFYLNPQIRIDLRLVPLVIGGLYFGSGLIFAGFSILLRAFIGIDSGFLVTVVVSLTLGVLLHFLRPYFIKQSKPRRYFMVTLFSIISAVFFLSTIHYLDHPIHPVFDLKFLLSYIVISTIGAGIIAYAIESIQYNRKMREQVVKAKRIEALSQMGAAMSHEIRNPLTSARGFLQFMSEDKTLNHNYSDYIGIVLNELDQAEEVIVNYLTFAKPPMEKVEEIDIRVSLRQVLNELSPLIEKNQVVLGEILNPVNIIHADKQMIERCFYNLIKNSVDSMPNGGRLGILTKETKKEIKLIITDTGSGMTEEEINRIGEPFYSLDEENGTGLGMMIAHSIIRAMNGTLEIKSQVDQGTSFTVSIAK